MQPSYRKIKNLTLQECLDRCTKDGGRCTGIEHFAKQTAKEVSCHLQRGKKIHTTTNTTENDETCYKRIIPGVAAAAADQAGNVDSDKNDKNTATVAATTMPDAVGNYALMGVCAGARGVPAARIFALPRQVPIFRERPAPFRHLLLRAWPRAPCARKGVASF